jgi:hypothetical protein
MVQWTQKQFIRNSLKTGHSMLVTQSLYLMSGTKTNEEQTPRKRKEEWSHMPYENDILNC